MLSEFFTGTALVILTLWNSYLWFSLKSKQVSIQRMAVAVSREAYYASFFHDYSYDGQPLDDEWYAVSKEYIAIRERVLKEAGNV